MTGLLERQGGSIGLEGCGDRGDLGVVEEVGLDLGFGETLGFEGLFWGVKEGGELFDGGLLVIVI